MGRVVLPLPLWDGDPTSGRGYVEVAHLWATSDSAPRCEAVGTLHSGKGLVTRSGPLVGHLDSNPPRSEAVGTPERQGQNVAKWPTSGPLGYITPAASGIPTASERGAESEVAHKWAGWLHSHCRMGDPHFRAGGSQKGPLLIP